MNKIKVLLVALTFGLLVTTSWARFIEDGKGKGNLAGVDDKQRLSVFAVTETEFEEASEDGDAFAWVTPVIWNTSDGDTLLLIKNTNSGADLHIETMWVSVTTNAGIIAHIPTAEVTLVGTTVVGSNLNSGSNNAAEAEAVHSETSNTQGKIIWHTFPEAGESEFVDFRGAVIITQNQSFAIDISSGTQRSQITVWGHYISE